MFDAAIVAEDVSIREIARRLAGDNATTAQVETKRRALGRYLGDEHTPRHPTAKKIARALGMPEDHFDVLYPEREMRLSTTKQLQAIKALVVELRELIAKQTGINAEATAELEGRLEEVAGLVAEGLARVEAGVADVARRLPPEERPNHSDGSPS